MPSSSFHTTCRPRRSAHLSPLCRWRPTVCDLTSALLLCAPPPGRFAEAAVCCRTLQNIYSDADQPDEASRYGELAERYEERSATPARIAPHEDEHIFLDASAGEAQEEAHEEVHEVQGAEPEVAE